MAQRIGLRVEVGFQKRLQRVLVRLVGQTLILKRFVATPHDDRYVRVVSKVGTFSRGLNCLKDQL
jgi:hypothetical protein